jgi:hypothetical protein
MSCVFRVRESPLFAWRKCLRPAVPRKRPVDRTLRRMGRTRYFALGGRDDGGGEAGSTREVEPRGVTRASRARVRLHRSALMFGGRTRICAATAPIDLRRSVDGLPAAARDQVGPHRPPHPVQKVETWLGPHAESPTIARERPWRSTPRSSRRSSRESFLAAHGR